MAPLNSESHKKEQSAPRIQVTDGALIPAKGDKSSLLTWRITFFGAIGLIAFLAIFYPDPYLKILKFVPDGILITFEVTILAIICATFIGLLAGLGQISRVPALNRITTIYIEVIRGIPLLVQLFYIYYALGRFFHLQGMAAAVIAMAVCYGAYMGEIFRAGIQSIPKGQMEAAIALGLTRGQALRKVILPQTIKVILPAIGNEFIALLKDSSLVSVLAISDLLRRGREFASTTFLYFEAYSLIALIYLVLTLFLSRLVGMMEERMTIDGK
ncbi:MAG: amino acid ABC transporter permease [Spirochaetales bacterium]|nr:amino acid ABC transporter permease [Spirochaetales bacterium]